MKYSEVERKLKKHGCCYKRGGAHPVWFSPITQKEFLLSNHQSEEVRQGTLMQISKLSGVKL
ncbi:MAG: type II toxin-antitoxin system HicA family toxin [Prevotellaceae bacterium]|jgi:predicted RNA binding protein YcfA (HicA-like mRNA interferase family)|nr:type II toxin-antitoxin system HicA family toxin [Prevotellaceae bacterium]